jgi:CopA family copper-resistance protein
MSRPNVKRVTRRPVLSGAGALGLWSACSRLAPAYARPHNPELGQNETRNPIFDLTIAETRLWVAGREHPVMSINGSLPGPLVRFREGDDVVLRVTNRLAETTSIHWHGLLVPHQMDGVPGVSFAGIRPGATFPYRFQAKQSGTYWLHSHSGMQEFRGVYAPLIIDPIEPEPHAYDREYVVLLSDWTFEDPHRIVANLKKQAGYYNFQKRTAVDFFSDLARKGIGSTLSDYLQWSEMRMDPTDFADASGYAFRYLLNGMSPETAWTGLFRPGEKLRLRLINAAATTFFDVRIPGLKLVVVQADGQNVEPVMVDELRMGAAETYDVIVAPADARAYTLLAETSDRSGFALGTLAPRLGMRGAVPKRRSRPIRTMADMGMKMGHDGMPKSGGESMAGMDHDSAGGTPPGAAGAGGPSTQPAEVRHPDHATGSPNAGARRSAIPGSTPVEHGPDHHGTENQTTPEQTRSRLHEPGTGLGTDGWRVLVYTDLRAVKPYPDRRKPERELEIHITGHMERFIWSFDGKKYSDAKEPIQFRYGERLRWTFVNDTMMEHPLHLHGMFMELENGSGDYLPRKHTVIVKPAERVSVAITADALGRWAFHCHLLLHMELGMFRVVEVVDALARHER